MEANVIGNPVEYATCKQTQPAAIRFPSWDVIARLKQASGNSRSYPPRRQNCAPVASVGRAPEDRTVARTGTEVDEYGATPFEGNSVAPGRSRFPSLAASA